MISGTGNVFYWLLLTHSLRNKSDREIDEKKAARNQSMAEALGLLYNGNNVANGSSMTSASSADATASSSTSSKDTSSGRNAVFAINTEIGKAQTTQHHTTENAAVNLQLVRVV